MLHLPPPPLDEQDNMLQKINETITYLTETITYLFYLF